jgi:hypothetical protein
MSYNANSEYRWRVSTILGRLHRPLPEPGAVRPKSQFHPDVCTLTGMAERNPLDELRERIGEAMRASPVQDLEKNLHALMVAFFDRFDLAAREDLEVHKKLLERAQAKLAALEARVAELESRKP